MVQKPGKNTRAHPRKARQGGVQREDGGPHLRKPVGLGDKVSWGHLMRAFVEVKGAALRGKRSSRG